MTPLILPKLIDLSRITRLGLDVAAMNVEPVDPDLPCDQIDWDAVEQTERTARTKQTILIQKSNYDAFQAGTHRGRTLDFEVADAHAQYEVCWCDDSWALLRHIDDGCGYQCSVLEDLSTHHVDPLSPDGILFRVPAGFVTRRIAQADEHLAPKSPSEAELALITGL